MLLYGGIAQHDALLDADTLTNGHAFSDAHIGTELMYLVNLKLLLQTTEYIKKDNYIRWMLCLYLLLINIRS